MQPFASASLLLADLRYACPGQAVTPICIRGLITAAKARPCYAHHNSFQDRTTSFCTNNSIINNKWGCRIWIKCGNPISVMRVIRDQVNADQLFCNSCIVCALTVCECKERVLRTGIVQDLNIEAPAFQSASAEDLLTFC